MCVFVCVFVVRHGTDLRTVAVVTCLLKYFTAFRRAPRIQYLVPCLRTIIELDWCVCVYACVCSCVRVCLRVYFPHPSVNTTLSLVCFQGKPLHDTGGEKAAVRGSRGGVREGLEREQVRRDL